jgi:Concanavalin A-like lectin/glucanases superfamily/Secretion system C-terminal sorting domain
MKKFLLILICILNAVVFYGQNTPSYVPQNGLKAWYSFSGNALDSSGSNLNGYVVGATLTKDRFGKSNSAYNFADNQFITIPNSSSLNHYPLTVSLWYNASTYPTGGECNIFSKYVAASWNGFQILYGDNTRVDNSGKIENNGFGVQSWYVRNISNKCIGYYNEPAFLQSNISINKWYHYVFVLDDTGGKIYVDGNLISTHKWTGTAGPSSNNYLWKIGGQYGGSKFFNGIIDDIGIWNRPLTESEIKNLYTTKRCTPPAAPNVYVPTQCSFDNKTFADLSNNNLYKWYSNLTDTVEISKYKLISNGTYYVSQVVNGCESVERTKTSIYIIQASSKTASISVKGNTPLCNQDGIFTISGGDPSGVVKYKLNNGPEAYLVLDGNGNGNVSIGQVTTNQYIELTGLSTTDQCYAPITSATKTAKIYSSISATAGTVYVSANGPFCLNGTGVFTVGGGDPNGIVKYKINGQAEQIQKLDGSGSATISLGNISTNQTIVLTSVGTSTSCSSVVTSPKYSATILINQESSNAKSISVTGNGPFCVKGAAVFTVSGGSPNGIIKYKINGQTEKSKMLDASGLATISLGTIASNQSIVLTSLTTSTGCTLDITSAAKSAVISINQMSYKGRTVSVTSNSPICLSGAGIFSISGGDSNGSVKYTINGQAEQSTVLDASGSSTIKMGSISSNQTIVLTSVLTSMGCSSAVSSTKKSSTITINPSSTKAGSISVNANGPLCMNGTGMFTVNGGESNGSVKYKIDGGVEQIQSLDNSGSATINMGNITTSKSIVLTSSVTSLGCSSVVTSASANATITINPTSTKGNTISVSANGPFCMNGTGMFTVSGGESNGSVKYKINGGPELTQVLDNSGSATIDIGNITTSKSIVLTNSVTSTGCSSVVTSATASAIITINPTSAKGGTISVFGNGPFCGNGNGIFTVNGGEPNGSVRYTINGATEQTQSLDANGSATISLYNIATNQTIELTTLLNLNGCSSKVTSPTKTATITIGKLSTASSTISVYSNGDICTGGNGNFIIKNGEPNSYVYYSLNNTRGEVKLDQNGYANINLTNVTSSQTIILLSIRSNSGCTTKISSSTNTAIIKIANSSPVSTPSEQNFCWMDNKKVKDLIVVPNNVVWFDAPTGGTQLNPEELLKSKLYYAVSTTCIYSTRTKTNVIVRDPMPISTNTEVNFCEGIGKLTLADLKPNGSNIAWFKDATIKEELATTTLLTTTSYYVGERLGSCTFNRTKVNVNFNSNFIIGDTLVCKGTKAQLKVYNQNPTGNYSIGSKGPAGGYIFYDQGKEINGWRYMEVTPMDIVSSNSYSMGCYCVDVLNTSAAIGSGVLNTKQWESAGCPTIAKGYSFGNYKDWFVPSRDELNLIYQNLKLKNIGNFNNIQYWSSTPAGYGSCGINGGVSVQNFSTGAQLSEYRNGYQGSGNLRLIRAFSSNTSFYKWSTGDTTETISVYPDKSTTYWVDITSNGSTCRRYITVKVNEAIPPILTIVNQNTICSDGYARLNLISNSGSNNFNWYRNNNLFLSGTNLLTTKENGEYYAVDLSNKCSSKSNSVFVNLNDAKISIQPIASLILKKSNEIELIASPKGGTFSGEGVSGNFFYPNKCRLGAKKITYSLNSSNNICRGTATISTIIVDSTENICHFYDTVKVTKYDTIKTYTSVTDTLKIKLKLTTGIYANGFNNIKIYPNPTVSDVMIDFGNYKYMQGYYLSITDVNGKRLDIFPINQQVLSINLASLGGPGIYFFNFHDVNSRIIETKKIILE